MIEIIKLFIVRKVIIFNFSMSGIAGQFAAAYEKNERLRRARVGNAEGKSNALMKMVQAELTRASRTDTGELVGIQPELWILALNYITDTAVLPDVQHP